MVDIINGGTRASVEVISGPARTSWVGAPEELEAMLRRVAEDLRADDQRECRCRP